MEEQQLGEEDYYKYNNNEDTVMDTTTGGNFYGHTLANAENGEEYLQNDDYNHNNFHFEDYKSTSIPDENQSFGQYFSPAVHQIKSKAVNLE